MSVAPDAAGGFLLSGLATPAQYQAILSSLRYVNVLALPASAERVVAVTVDDGTGVSNTAFARLSSASFGSSTVDKYLYLSDPGQGMDRVDPVATSDVTTSSVPVVPVVGDASTGLAAWTNVARKDLESRPWILSGFGPQQAFAADGAGWVTMVAAASAQRDEAIVVGVTADRHVSGAVWNGAAFSPVVIVVGGTSRQDLGAPSQAGRWGVAVAYETNSGRALLAWNTGSTLNYSLWNGTSWTAAATIPAYTGTEPRQLRLVSNPLAGSNEMVLAVTSANEVDRALVWNGSAWGNAIQLDNNTGHDFTDMAVAYEQQSGRAIVTYASGTAGAVGYNIWNGTAWSAAASVAAPAGSNNYAQWTVLAADPNSNRIVLGVESNGNDAWMNVWSGTAWGTSNLGVQNGVTNAGNLGIAVAFESRSGEALAVFQNDQVTAELGYATWNPATGWSAATNFGAFNQGSRSVTLSPNSYSDQVMLLVNDNARILRSVLWSGSAFAGPVQLESDTNTTSGQPFAFVWERWVPGAVTSVTSFQQTSAMTAPFVLPPGGAARITLYIQLTSGTLPAAPKLAAKLTGSGSSFLTLSTPVVTSLGGGMYKLEWTGSMPALVTLPEGGQIALTLIDYDATYSFNILYDSATYPSQVRVATATAIAVDPLGVFAAAYPSGSPVSSCEAGAPAYVRFTASDPFGASDVTGADLVVRNSLGATVLAASLGDANVVASTAGGKTYERVFTPLSTDTYTATVTAHEGTEGVTATAQTTFTAIARPDLAATVSDGGATVSPGGSVAYVVSYANAGLGVATGVLVTGFLPAGTTFDAAASSAGWTPLGSGAWRFAVGTLAPGASGSVLFAARVPARIPAALEQIEARVAIADDGTHGADAAPGNNQALDTTPLVAAPDLVLALTDGGTSTAPGAKVLYRLSYANAGQEDARGVILHETLPANTTFAAAGSSPGWAVMGGGAFTLAVGDVPAGASGLVLFAVAVDSPLPGGVTQIVNVATIADDSAGGPDANPADNTASDTTPVDAGPQADLRVTLTNGVASLGPGASVTYAATVTNTGPTAVTGAAFADTVPASLTGVSFTTSASAGSSAVPPAGSGNAVAGLLGLPPGGSVAYTISGTLATTATGTLVNTATVLAPAGTVDPDTTSNTAVDEDPIVPVSDLSLTMAYATTDLDGSGMLTPGDRVVFTLTATNGGPHAAAGVSVRDLLPGGWVYESDDAAVSGGTYAPVTGLWTIGSIGAGDAALLHLSATLGSAGETANAAEIFSSASSDPDSTPGNGVPTEDDYGSVAPAAAPSSDLRLSMTMALTSDLDGNGILSIGDRVTFTLALENGGPSAAAGVHVADLLPAGYAFVSATPGVGTYTAATGDWSVGTVGAPGTATLNVTTTILGGRPAEMYANYAQVSASGSFDADSTPGDSSTNADDDATVAPPLADLSLTQTVAFAPGGDLDANGTPSTGDQVIFNVTVANAGPEMAADVRVLDQLPSGYTYLADDAAGSYDPLTGLWQTGVVAPGATKTLKLTVTINAAGSWANTAQVTASSRFDPDSTPNNGVASEDDQGTVTLVPGVAAMPPVAVNDSLLHRLPGVATLDVTLNDTDPNLDVAPGTVDLNPGVAGRQTTLTVAGQGTWSVDALGKVTFTPQPGFTQDPTPITYTVQDAGGRTSNQATITLDYVPVASNDGGSGYTPGSAAIVPVLANDATGDTPVPSTVRILGTPGAGVALVVAGEGTWSVNTTTGALTFTPQAGFAGDPSPIQYTVEDNDGNTSNAATVSLDFLQHAPVAANDSSLDNVPGAMTIDVTANDTDADGDVDEATVDLDPVTPGRQALLAVVGEGLWTADDGGAVTFFPEAGFTGEPTPIAYTVKDRTGLASNTATIRAALHPAIHVIKVAGPAGIPESGGTVVYGYAVTNTSPAGAADPLLGLALVDPDGAPVFVGGDADGDGRLDAGESWSYTLTKTFPAAAVGSTYTSSALVSAADDEGTPVSATADATVTWVNVAPSVVVAASAPAMVEGNAATITITITNTSAASTDPVTFTSVVSDSFGDLTAAAQAAWITQGHSLPIVLSQGASFTFGATTGPLNASTVVNSVTVSGHDDEGTAALASGSHVLTVSNAAPSVAVDVSAAAIAEGNAATYTFTITNTSPASTDPVTVTSVVDNVLGDLTAAALAANGGGPIVLLPGQSFTFSFTTSAPLNAGTVVDTVTVSGHDDEGSPASATDSQSLGVSDVYPSMTVSILGPATSTQGDPATYTFTITNTSTAATDPVTVTSVVDDVLGDLTAAAQAAWGVGPIVLTPGASFSFSTTTTSLPLGSVVDTVTVQGHDDENSFAGATASHTVVVSAAPADVSLAMTVDDATPSTGQGVTFTLTAANHGPNAVSGVAVNELLPSGLAWVSSAPSAGTSYDPAAGVWNVGGLASGASASLSITATVTAAGTIVVRAVKTAQVERDPDPSNDSASAGLNTGPLADVQLAQSVDDAAPVTGANVVFVVTARNAGPSGAANVVVTDLLPPGVTFVGATPSAGSYDPATGAWSVGTLASGGAQTLSLSVRVDAPGPITNLAAKSQAEPDPDAANDTATAVLNGAALADLAIAKIASPEPAPAGSSLSFTISVVNRGPGPATNVTVTDSLPSGLSGVTGVPSQGSCSGTSTVTCPLGTLPAGASAWIRITATKPQPGSLSNSATVAADESDPYLGNNSSSAASTPVGLTRFEAE